MKPLKLIPIADQVAAHLRGEIECGQLAGELPGAKKLAELLGVNHKTVDAACLLLESQGLVESQGAGKPRRITPPQKAAQSLRIGILTYEPQDEQDQLSIKMQHSLAQAGHVCRLSEKSQREMRWDLNRIKKLVAKNPADAWIVHSGPRDILEWFSRQPFPTLAIYGRFLNLPVAAAGVLKVPAVMQAIDQLTSLGHRRIIMLSERSDRLPSPGYAQRVFLEQLEAKGIQTGPYNLPDWESSPQGLQQALDTIFKITPPTALFVTDYNLLFPIYTHLLKGGIAAPEKLSLICTGAMPSFAWCTPPIAHMHWDRSKLVHRVLKWAEKTANGKVDIEQNFIEAELDPGGTIGPAPGYKPPVSQAIP